MLRNSDPLFILDLACIRNKYSTMKKHLNKGGIVEKNQKNRKPI